MADHYGKEMKRVVDMEQENGVAFSDEELQRLFPNKNKQSFKAKHRGTRTSMLTKGEPLNSQIYETSK